MTRLIVALALVACSAPVEDTEELGQAELGFSAKRTATYQYGVTTTASRMQCPRFALPTMQCTIPAFLTKTLTYRIDSGLGVPGDPYNDEIWAAIEAIDNGTNWTLNEVFEGPADIVIVDSVCGNVPNTRIDRYGCLIVQDGGALVEGAGVVGQYRWHTNGMGIVDILDIESRASGVARLRLLRHAAGHVMLAYLGLGSREDLASDGFMSSRFVNTDVSPAALTSGEVCRLDTFVAWNNGLFTLQMSDCAGAD